jgi:hypothetical protein
MGDLIDAADLSEKFKKNPARKETLQDEINMGRAHLAHMRKSVPMLASSCSKETTKSA